MRLLLSKPSSTDLLNGLKGAGSPAFRNVARKTDEVQGSTLFATIANTGVNSNLLKISLIGVNVSCAAF
jgi:hypothetical protein